ncbi:uncharacterized protein LOC144305106 [Canis aureus]
MWKVRGVSQTGFGTYLCKSWNLQPSTSKPSTPPLLPLPSPDSNLNDYKTYLLGANGPVLYASDPSLVHLFRGQLLESARAVVAGASWWTALRAHARASLGPPGGAGLTGHVQASLVPLGEPGLRAHGRASLAPPGGAGLRAHAWASLVPLGELDSERMRGRRWRLLVELDSERMRGHHWCLLVSWTQSACVGDAGASWWSWTQRARAGVAGASG